MRRRRFIPALAGRARLGACLAASICACVAAPAAADTLKEALVQTYRANPTLEAARAQLRALDESVVIQRSQALPSVDTSGTYTEFLKQGSSNFISPDRQLSANIDLGLPIYSGGAIRNSILAARNRVEAGRADLRGTESFVFAQVVAAYLDVIQQEAIVGLALNNVEVLETNFQATSDRFEIGDLTRTDVAQSQSRLAIAIGDLSAARANLLTAREDYIALVGEAPTDLAPPPPLPGLPDEPEEAVAIALANNPDLLAAIETAEAEGYEIEVAEAGRLPRLELVTGGGYQNYLGTLGSAPGGVANQTSTSAQAGVRFTLPLFQGGRVAAQQRQATAQAAAALEQVIAVERDIIATVRASFSSWRAALAIIESSQVAVEAAELSHEGVRAENTVGNRTILDILDAQRELLSAQVQLVTARRNAYVAGFNLLAAMGRAEARDLGLESDVPLYDPIDNFERVDGIIWDWQSDPDPVARSTRTIDIEAPTGNIPDEDTIGPTLEREGL